MIKLTEKEKRLLDTLRVCDIAVAAESLNITRATVYTILYRIRAKQQAAKEFLQQLKRYEKVLGKPR